MKKILVGISFVAIATFSVWTFISEPVLRDSSASVIHNERVPTSVTSMQTSSDDRMVAAAVFDKSLDQESSNQTSLEAKLKRQKANAIGMSGLSEEDLNATQDLILNTFYDPKGTSNFLTDLHERLTDQIGAEEADFQLAVINSAGDWKQLKRLVADRATALGAPHYYDALLLDVGINTGSISAEEVEILVSRGGVLPDDVILDLASHGNVDAIKGLDERGMLGNRNYEDPLLSMNAIGAFIKHASNYPGKYDPESAKNALSTLIHIGIETQPTNGSLDPLDIALEYTNIDNADIKFALVKVLIENGAIIEESHIELLRRIRDVSTRNQLEILLANNL